MDTYTPTDAVRRDLVSACTAGGGSPELGGTARCVRCLFPTEERVSELARELGVTPPKADGIFAMPAALD
jgi:hypothetical protein